MVISPRFPSPKSTFTCLLALPSLRIHGICGVQTAYLVTFIIVISSWVCVVGITHSRFKQAWNRPSFVMCKLADRIMEVDRDRIHHVAVVTWLD